VIGVSLEQQSKEIGAGGPQFFISYQKTKKHQPPKNTTHQKQPKKRKKENPKKPGPGTE